MPAGDRTGPLGKGSRTGRGLGYCEGNDHPGYEKAPGQRRGPGRGWGRGRGRGRGQGPGRCYGRGYGRRQGRSSDED